ncbi:MAG TPA: DUF1080 domain-containing protein [Planctomycetia bacterium]|nr:DUF1080 domain-containing protein [Planctomycetia bacterium]
MTTLLLVAVAAGVADEGFTPLFRADGEPKGWVVRHWADVSKPATAGAKFEVRKGTLEGSPERGCWLLSEKEYGDFIVEFEFKLGPQGNSGFALRSPAQGDPAFDGLEIQMADKRYNPEAKDSELTAGIYRAAAPAKQVYKPEEWNTMRVEAKGAKVKVTLNGEVVQDADLDKFTAGVLRHDGTPAPSLRERPRRGRIGFQELSRGGSRALVRNARIKSLDPR